ncbi:MAG: hypothetical protein BV457_02395 [Thermoplasmata archaeon M9B1D]|nr:MAG: hypothetical protein BV457_02395 [Thermoplasmata archaeon M9B1D]PNX49631.1 MAG: hypothetical protein BV456_08740 [Thermoplasmata archaeon M8B2D]
MKKYLIVIGAIFIVFLMVSNATAVQQINSEPIKNVIDKKQQITLLEEKLEFYIEKLDLFTSDVQPKGLIDIILAIIQAIVDFLTNIIYKIIDFINQLQNLLSVLINAIKALINKIIEFIEWLQDLFNPESNTVIK